MTRRPFSVEARTWLVIALVLLGLASIVFSLRLRAQLATGMAVVAKQLCSLEFVSGLDRRHAQQLYLSGLLRGADEDLRIETDLDQRVVGVSLAGLLTRRAQYRPGLGCTLQLDSSRTLEDVPRAAHPSRAMLLDASHRDSVFHTDALDRALEQAFESERGRPPVNTLAIVVLHDGRLVAERYAEGIEPETRLPGWSMTKSVTATLVGVLVGQGRLDVYAPGAIREWRGKADERSRITLDHLLRMTSGLLITETAERGDGLDPSSQMLYGEADAAAFAATRRLEHDVGTHFEYMSGNTILAMRAAQEAIGGDLADALEFIHAELFAPLGMQSAVIEADQTGTLLGSTHMFAPARDWARLGQLYLDGGWADGRRVLTREWIEYVTTPTEKSLASRRGGVFWESGRGAYGAGFWLFGGEVEEGEAGRSPLPRDAFDANGFQGQYLHIIPSKRLVVVRLGATDYRDFDHERLPFEVIAAMKKEG